MPLFTHIRRPVRRFFTAVVQLLIFGNGYIALCAVVMCQTTARLFAVQVPESFLPFVFAGTLGSYCLHWYLTGVPGTETPAYTGRAAVRTNRIDWNESHKPTLLLLFVAAALVGLWLLAQLKPDWPDLLPVLILTFLYTAPKINWRPFRALRRIAVLKTAYLALVWAYVTAIVPLLIARPAAGPDGLLAGLWFLNRFLLIYSIALWFDYRDRADDRQSRWLTIVSMLTDRQVQTFFYSIAGGFALTVFGLARQGLDAWTLLCLSLPMVLLLLTARFITQQSSDYWYYVYLDGLLMLSGVLLWLVPRQSV